MPTVEVFLMFKPTERNGRTTKIQNGQTTKTQKTVEAGPNWQSIKAQLKQIGYTLIVNGPSAHPSVQDIQNSMHNAEATVIVGHGARTPGAGGSKFISDHITLSDGMIKSPDGVLVGKWKSDGSLERVRTDGKLTINKVTGLFTCDSTDKLPDAFNLPPGSHLVTNDGGKDGLTRIGTLEQGAAEFVRSYALTKGNVREAMSRAQSVFAVNGQEWDSDKGDRLSDKVGADPPLPEVGEEGDCR